MSWWGFRIVYPNGYNMISQNRELGSFVKQKRKEVGITQEELSQKAGVGLRFVRELERGKETLQMNKVNQVLSLFGCILGVTPMDRERWLSEEG